MGGKKISIFLIWMKEEREREKEEEKMFSGWLDFLFGG